MTFSNKDYAPLSGRVDGATTAYPLGAFRDESVEGADDGTPYISDIGKDKDGFKQAVLALGGKSDVDLNGAPDTADNCEVLDALLNQVDGGFNFYKTAVGPDVVRTTVDDDKLASYSVKNTTYQQRSALENGALSFLTGTIGGPGDTSVKVRVSDFNLDISDLTYFSASPLDYVTYTPAAPLPLTGIPFGTKFHSISIEIVEASFTMVMALNADVTDSSGVAAIIGATAVTGGTFSPAGLSGTAKITVTYDPSLVD
jgi:hypothetical protein